MKKQLPTTGAEIIDQCIPGVYYSNTLTSCVKRLMHPFVLSLFVFILTAWFAGEAKADFSVTTNGGSGLMATYPSLAAAISALNLATITSPVVITCPTGTETSPAGGYSITATGTAVNTIMINGNGAANSIVTAPSPAGTVGNLNDAIFKIIGGDFITISGFAMNENAANDGSPIAEFTAGTNTMVEWGVALLYASTTNGAQNCIIQNNSITLNRLYQNSFGIYSNSTHSATSITSATATTTAGGNSGLKIYGNAISNVNNGIVVVGPTAAADANTGIDIGGAGGAQANTITNYGTTGTFSGYANVSGTVNGILVRNSIGFNVSFNTVTSSVGGTTAGTLNGIQIQASSATPTTTFTNNINSNTISLQSAVAAGGMVGISYPSGSASTTSTLNVNSNNFTTFGHTVAASGTITFISVASTNQFTTISSNMFTNISVNTTGSVTFISQSFTASSTGTKTVNNNAIVTGFTKTGAGGTVIFVTDNGSTVAGAVSNCTNNNFSNVTLTGATAITGLNYTDGGTAPTRTVTGNILNNWTTGAATITAMNFTYWNGVSSLSTNTITNITGQGAIIGISLGSAANNATSVAISSNTITNLSSTGTGGAVSGIICANTSTLININNNTIRTLSSTGPSPVNGIVVSLATTNNVFKNTICDLSGTNASSTVNGILVSVGTTVNLSNNRIGDLRATAANATNPLNGINITGGTTVNAYYNSVYLNGMSSGALFGSSAISVSTTPTVTLNNNIFVNLSSVMGAGLAVAYRRSTSTLTTYGATSDRNDFFASTIYTDGTGPNTFITLGTYKTHVGPTRDANSVTENPPFLSTSCGSSDFLKVNTVTPTIVESNGINITGITDDFENDIRFGNPGYIGTSTTRPDIGADEFNGTPSVQCMGAPAAGSITGAAAVCTGLGTTLTLSGASTDLNVVYQWKSSTTMGGPYTTILGTSTTQATGPLTMPAYYIVEVTCTNPGGSTTTTSEKSVLVNPLPTVMVSPTSGSICIPGGSPIMLTASGASTYTWSPTTGLTPTSGAVVSANPAVNTTYTVTGADMNGCTNTATSAITLNFAPQNVTAIATPASICSGTSSNLTSSALVSTTVNNYLFATSTGAALDPMAGATTVVVSGVDDAPMGAVAATTTAGPYVALPFNFNLHGANYTFFSASPDGWMSFSNSSAVATSSFTNTTTLTTNTPKIYPYWDDLATGTTGSVQTLVTGSAPNRIFKVQWFVTIPRATGGAANSTFQAWLYESTNVVELRYGTMGVATASSSGGLSGGALFNSLTFATNTASNSVANDAQIGTPASGRMYTFSPPAAFTYAWDPSGDVVDPSNQNTATNNLSSTTIFTVTVTNGGCSNTASATVTVDPLVCLPATVSAAHCANTNFTVTANISGGGAPFSYAWDDGVGGVYPDAQMITANLPAGMYTFTATVSDNCGAMCTSSVAVTVNGLPTIMVSPPSGAICNPGGSPIVLTASGASTYTWSPTTGLTPTSGSPVSASPAMTTIYTVSGTDINGCVNTASSTVNVGAIPLVSASAIPSLICTGNNSQLIASASANGDYTVSSTTYALQPITGFTDGPSGDDNISSAIPLPFNFSFYGTSYASIFINTNGQAGFDFTGSTAALQRTAQTIPNTTLPNANISLCWADLNPTAGQIKYGTTGTTPNRIFVINFNAAPFFSGGGVVSGQIQLFEATNKIQIHLTSVTTNTALKTVGIENASGTIATAPAARNNFNFLIASPEAWEFSQTFTYLWSPTTFIPGGQETTYNPLATAVTSPTNYTVTVTNGFCSNTSSVSVNVTTLTLMTSTTQANCPLQNDGSATVVPSGGSIPYTYLWSNTATTATASGLTAGTYTVTVTDNIGCTATASAIVTNNPAGPVHNMNTGLDYCNIQAAINAPLTLNGHKIIVDAGTYTENVNVTKELEIQGAGQGLTIVRPAVSNPTGGSLGSVIFLVQANNVLIHDLTVDGKNPLITGAADIDASTGIINDWSTGDWTSMTIHHVTVQDVYLRGIEAANNVAATNTFNIHHNIITGVQSDPSSIAIFNYGEAGPINNNTITFCNGGIFTNYGFGSNISNNNITNPAGAVGIESDNNGGAGGGSVADVISTNTITGGAYGVYIYQPSLVSDIFDNTISNATTGIYVNGGPGSANIHNNDATINGNVIGIDVDGASATITGNVIYDNGIGVRFTNAGTGNVNTNDFDGGINPDNGRDIQLTPNAGLVTASPNNNLAGDTYGVENLTTTDVDATLNYWESPTGPGPVGPGTGAPVTTKVIYCPWLNAPPPGGTPVSTPASIAVTETSGVANNDGIICSGASVMLAASPAGGTYLWAPGGETTSSITVSPGMTTLYTVTVSYPGCDYIASTNITVNPSPSATITSNTSIYQGSSGNIASVPDAGTGASYVWSLSSGMITSGAGTNSIIYNAGTPPSMTISVTVTSANGCSSSSSNVVMVLVPGPSTMIWEPDNITPTPLCGPATNCCKDTLCFNLKYTPGVTGFLTTYTTGFFINCLGGTPVGYNKSCVMTDNSFQIGNCAAPMDSVLFNSSGQNGGMAVAITQGSPKILHRLCLNIATGESAQIREDIITNLTASVDQVGSGHITEFPTYAPQTFSKPGFIVPANVTVTINCPADTLFPVPPPRFDFCGNPVQDSLISRVSVPSSLTCEGSKTYTFRYKDCSGYTQFWSFTYVIEYLDFSIAAGPGGSIVACPALSDVVPTPPVVVDHCGQTITPTFTDTGRPVCEGFRFYVFTYTDCEGNTHNWVYAYNVEYEPIPNPVDVTQTVNCPLLANVVPTPPVVNDNCGLPLTPISMSSTPALLATTCEGTRTFTWVYQDCENNTQDFMYTYIVERQPFNDPADIGMTVACPVKTDSIPTPPAVVDNCGASLSPVGPVVSPIPACEGTRTYTWTYTDCEGNSANYVFTYTVDRPVFTVPANAGSIVNCPQASNVVPVAPTVIDACGVSLIPFDTIASAPVTCQGVDVIRTYTFYFKDCTGFTLTWMYTYTVRCFPLTLKVFLEGPYDAMGDTMKATLNTNHVLPGQDKLLSPSMSVQLQAPYTPFGQPYNMPPWNYNGNTGLQYGDPFAPGAPMGVIPYPADVVDWVLVTVRKGGRLPVNNFWTCAGWVHSDGEVTFPDPCGGLVFLPGDSCYVMVQHRTHLGVMSTNAATTTCANYIINWDFTTSNSYQPIFRYGQRLVEPGKWAMHAANGDQVTSIAAIGSADLTTWRIFQNAYGYSIGDYNMSAFTESAGDESLWKANQNRTSGIIFY